MTGAARAMGGSLGWLAGPALWAAFFLVAYASEWLVCTRMSERGWHDALVIAAGLGAVLPVIVRLGRVSQQPERAVGRFLQRVGLALDWLSLAAIGWTMSASLILPACTR